MAADSDLEAFHYNPLSQTKRQIRLITIDRCGTNAAEPNPPSSDIHLTLHYFDFDSHPDYQALSYTWGNKSPQTSIYVNDAHFLVSPGLSTFLEQAKQLDWLRGASTYLWIDQISIDQSDVQERSQQVSFMGEIYQGATEVLAWLGPATDDSGLAIKAIDTCDYEDAKKNQHALMDLFMRPYWRRLWIVQEMVLARAGRLLCGSDWVSLQRLFTFVRMLPRNQQNRFFDMAKPWVVSHWVLTLCFERSRKIDDQTLSHVIENFRGFQCADARDKVYGLQALIPLNSRVPVNYSIDCKALWIAVMRKIQAVEDMNDGDFTLFAEVLEDVLGIHVLAD